MCKVWNYIQVFSVELCLRRTFLFYPQSITPIGQGCQYLQNMYILFHMSIDMGRQELSPVEDVLTHEGGEDLSIMQRLNDIREEHPYVATAVETTLVWAGREVLTGAMHAHTEVKIGHGWKNSRAGRAFSHPLVAIAVGMLVSPNVEEYVFRERPSRHLDAIGHQGGQKSIGTVIAATFALGHAGREAVPVPQFIGGLNYWRLQRSRGMAHAVLSHTIHNGLAYGACRLRQRKVATSRG